MLLLEAELRQPRVKQTTDCFTIHFVDSVERGIGNGACVINAKATQLQALNYARSEIPKITLSIALRPVAVFIRASLTM